MRRRNKTKKLQTLEELLKATDTKQEFDIVADLQSLERAHSMLKSKDFKKKLRALVMKYEETELSEIRRALVDKCQNGDLAAIRLYKEHFAPAETAREDDGLIEALSKKSSEVFKDE